MRRGLCVLAAVFSAVGIVLVTEESAAGESEARPNVLLILVDDVGYGDLSCHGNPRLRTPHIDELYRESIRLTNFHVAPICTPSRSQLMTGLDALRNGAMNASSGRAILRYGLPTMADLFAANGYKTALFGKWHLGHTYPYRPGDRGFQETVWFPVSMISSDADAWRNDYFNDRYRHGDRLEQYRGYCTDVFFREAMTWMQRQHAQGHPFFVYLPLNAAHYMYWVESKYAEPYRDLPGDLPNFYGMIANIDENMGRLEAMLRRTGLRENTLVVFMSDNGSAVGWRFYNAGWRGHKFELWEGGHRVPCFLRWPAAGWDVPRDVPQLTQCQDLLPTLIDLCRLRPPEKARFDGLSLAPLLNGRISEQRDSWPDRMLVVQFSRPNIDLSKGNLCRPRKWDSAVLWRQWRLIKGTKLYDLNTDRRQRSDVAARYPQVVARMRAHYEHWWKGVEGGLDTLVPTYLGAAEQNPTTLTPDAWGDPPLWFDQWEQVLRGEQRNGTWHVLVTRPGRYRFSLRRWPGEIRIPMTRGLPAHSGELGKFPPGTALPIAKARLRVGRFDRTREVAAEQQSVDFTVTLDQGRTQVQTWFYDAQGNELCGAYYVEVYRLDARHDRSHGTQPGLKTGH